MLKKLKSRTNKSPLKIVISTPFFGGIGGVERRLKSIIDSMPENEFYIFSEKIIKGGFIPSGENYYLNTLLKKDNKYDLYIYFRCKNPPYLGDKYSFKKKIIITNGNEIFEKEHLFDYIFLDGKNCKKFCKEHNKCKIALPDVTITYPKRFKKIKNLPQKFLLTIFNPYGKIKGYKILRKVAKYSKLPIVWCYDDTTFGDFKNIIPIDNVIQFHNLPQEKIYYLFSKAEAYISFSLSESFGWSTADAFVLDLPIISRNIGIVTLIKNQKGIYIYNSEQKLKKYLINSRFAKPNYNKSILDKFNYKKQIKEVLK